MQGDSYHLRQSVDTQNKTFSPYFSSIDTSNNGQMHNSSQPTFTPPNQQKFDASEKATKMIPIDIDMNLKKNMGEHSTIYYDIQGLVLRRGQPFSFTITFNQDLPIDKYNLSIIFKSQTWQNFPRVKIPLNGSSNGWSAKRLSTKDQENNCVYFQICSPCDATIGKYSLFLEISPLKSGLATKQDLSVFQFDIDIYILFNPWNSTDVCGLLSSDQIAEYALSEHGQIYLGSSEIPQSIPWNFGQFDRDVLLTALSLLNKTSLPTESRIDMSLILRRLSSKVCSDPGAHDGIFPPSSDESLSLHQKNGYTSSSAILKQYLLSNGQSVQGGSGSNWQHAAVFCSLCRSLGIPSRIVTVYNATCGAQEQENINLHGGTRQRPIIVVNKKVTRPWYLWNECWMRRDDIPAQNSGWQVVDSSAIDYNTKMRRIGPCAVSALRSGTLSLKWDTPDIYSVLNANRSYWLVYPDRNMEENVTDTKVLTKSLRKENEYDDITSNYKLEKTSNQIPPHHDVNIDIDIPNSLRFGDNLQVILNATNLSNKPRTLAVALRLIRLNPTIEIKPNANNQTQAQHVFQNANPEIININSQTPIQSIVQAVRLDIYEDTIIPIKVAHHHQVWTGCFDSLLKLYISGIVKETGQIYQNEKYIINEHDEIMQVSIENDVIQEGQSAKLQIHLNNSSPFPLNNASITIDGFGISKTIPITEPLQSNTSTTIPAEFIPSRLGLSRLDITLTSDSIRVPPKSVALEVKEHIPQHDRNQDEQLTSSNINQEVTSPSSSEKSNTHHCQSITTTLPTKVSPSTPISQATPKETQPAASAPLTRPKSDDDDKSSLPQPSVNSKSIDELKAEAVPASTASKSVLEDKSNTPGVPPSTESKPASEVQANASIAAVESKHADEVIAEPPVAASESIPAHELKAEAPVAAAESVPADELKAEPPVAAAESVPDQEFKVEAPPAAAESLPTDEVKAEAPVAAADSISDQQFQVEAKVAAAGCVPVDVVKAEPPAAAAQSVPTDELKAEAPAAKAESVPVDEEKAEAPVGAAESAPTDEAKAAAPAIKTVPTDEAKAAAPAIETVPAPEVMTHSVASLLPEKIAADQLKLEIPAAAASVLTDEVKAEAPLAAAESIAGQEIKVEAPVAAAASVPTDEVKGEARGIESVPAPEVMAQSVASPLPEKTAVDELKPEIPAAAASVPADEIKSEVAAGEAQCKVGEEGRREMDVEVVYVVGPAVVAYEEERGDVALLGVVPSLKSVDHSETKIDCQKVDDNESLVSDEDGFGTPDTLPESGNELESVFAISNLSPSCGVLFETSGPFKSESLEQMVGSANADEVGIVPPGPLVVESEGPSEDIDMFEILQIVNVMAEMLGIPACVDSSRKGVSCGEPGLERIPEEMKENAPTVVVMQGKVAEADVLYGALSSDASKERVAETTLPSGSTVVPRIVITEVELFDCDKMTPLEQLNEVNEMLTSAIAQLETRFAMIDGNSASGDVEIISNDANVANNAEDSSHTNSISEAPNRESLPALGTLDDLRKAEGFQPICIGAVRVVEDSTVLANKMDSGDAADKNELTSTSSNESNTGNETVPAVSDDAKKPAGFIAKALVFFQRKSDAERESAEGDNQVVVDDLEEEKFTLIESVISNPAPPSGSEKEKKKNDNLTNAATSRKIHEKVAEHVASVDAGAAIENINPAVIESKIILQGLSSTIVDGKNIADSKPIVVSPVQSQIECSESVGNVEVTKQINDVKLESDFATGSNEISSKGAAMADNAQKSIDTKIEKIAEVK
ncbi:unnamed protein product [Rotaria socialis]|uniref:Transglutaminase-like domain-containing protein n=1 Tax=Rotaria socialis TaxID=392032 RepID=A0A821A5C1_9BILA|nr:unnamed protein product [Rotaria socialis]